MVGDGAAGADAGQSVVWLELTSKLGESLSNVNGTPLIFFSFNRNFKFLNN